MDNKEYNDFFNKNIRACIKDFETIRREYLVLCFFIYVLMIIACLFLIFRLQSKNFELLFAQIFLCSLVIMFLHPAACMVITRYRSVIKEKFLNNMLTKLYGLAYYNANPTIWTNILASFGMNDFLVTNHMDCEELQNLSVASGCSFSFDDFIKGKYNGLDVEIQELSCKKLMIKNSLPFWHGLVMSVDFKKDFCSKIVFYSDNEMCVRSANSGLERIYSEDVEFNKIFNVYSTDQIDARYIFNPVFMEKLKSIAKNNPDYKINGEFYNQKLYIVISSAKNWFEIPFFKSASNAEVYYQPVNDINNLISLLDTIIQGNKQAYN